MELTKWIDIYIQEFVGIVGFLQEEQPERTRSGWMTVSRQRINELFNENAYEEPQNKLQVWKSLNWIDTEENRFTKKNLQQGAEEIRAACVSRFKGL